MKKEEWAAERPFVFILPSLKNPPFVPWCCGGARLLLRDVGSPRFAWSEDGGTVKWKILNGETTVKAKWCVQMAAIGANPYALLRRKKTFFPGKHWQKEKKEKEACSHNNFFVARKSARTRISHENKEEIFFLFFFTFALLHSPHFRSHDLPPPSPISRLTYMGMGGTNWGGGGGERRFFWYFITPTQGRGIFHTFFVPNFHQVKGHLLIEFLREIEVFRTLLTLQEEKKIFFFLADIFSGESSCPSPHSPPRPPRRLRRAEPHPCALPAPQERRPRHCAACQERRRRAAGVRRAERSGVGVRPAAGAPYGEILLHIMIAN